MTKKATTAITPTREEDYPEWYQQVVRASGLAERSSVRGCMVIRPWGYSLWENIQRQLDDMFKETGVQNAYFPLFIPVSFLEREAAHVEGFAKECAVVTHHRLEKAEGGKLMPSGPLTEPLVVRPTSETIIGDSFSKWISSYRDLPLLINQWANVVRWEMRTRIFLRTSEFLWQEGHTVHATRREAEARTFQMLDVYARCVQDYLAIPVVKGRKSASERFPGAEDTLCIEAMMQDRKALQAGTSHFLGQNFAKASNITFQTRDEREDHGWTTSWGVSTRLIGGIIMAHGDDDGIILPPKVASAHAVILPIVRDEAQRADIMAYVEKVVSQLKKQYYHHRKARIVVDDRDIGGARNWEWIKKGIPLRIEIGPRDMEKDAVFVARRDKGVRDKQAVGRQAFVDGFTRLLDDIQQNLFDRALAYQKAHTRHISDKREFNAFFTPGDQQRSGIHGGFAVSPWCGDAACEAAIKEDLSVTIRCIPFDSQPVADGCIGCGKTQCRKVVFAKAY